MLATGGDAGCHRTQLPQQHGGNRAAEQAEDADPATVPQFRCLNFIAKAPGGSISAAAAFLGVTMPTASVMVDRLVRSGAAILVSVLVNSNVSLLF